jgi:hypothetical protein
VPHPHIQEETEKFRDRQDKINNFINIRLVKTTDEDIEIPMSVVLEKYSKWHNSLYPDDRDYKKSLTLQFENSKLSKIIVKNRLGSFIKGYRVLDTNELPEEDEEYFIDLFMDKKSKSECRTNSETSHEFHERVCREFDEACIVAKSKQKEAEKKMQEKKMDEIRNARSNGHGSPANVAHDIDEKQYPAPASEPEPKPEYDSSGFKINKKNPTGLSKEELNYFCSDGSESSCSDVEYESD